jgi:hypothetical protein
MAEVKRKRGRPRVHFPEGWEEDVVLEDQPANFRDARTGQPYVVRCPRCKLENWSMAVAKGYCGWCGWKAVWDEQR